jgi:hypothetical protein
VGCSPALGMDDGLTTPHRKKKKQLVTKHYTGPWTWIRSEYRNNGKWMWDLEHGVLGVSIGQVHWKQ